MSIDGPEETESELSPLARLIGYLDRFEFWFHIIEP
jgi:alkyl sulfatase BDS1-like metallo-beta-lactamase superfamily hydrolase